MSGGGGLFLLVQPTGPHLWRLSYHFSGKQKTMALGAYPDMSFSDARQRRNNQHLRHDRRRSPRQAEEGRLGKDDALTQFAAARSA
ncbi:Arm DNA-binding domain-containing protein [Breoghania sp.]|uniref:Arm DNA-binding domain-containing protein n=1 Tax=Breoghania sp. TaxID=2065378 RepID=UPI00320490B5